jgi:hypothetical protein
MSRDASGADEELIDCLRDAIQERDEARAKLDALLYQYNACHAEKDEARAALKREQDAAFAMSADLEVERMATNEARAIARRLAAALELSEPPWTPKTREALEHFRACPWAWAKDDA